jgi:hypothetical protein
MTSAIIAPPQVNGTARECREGEAERANRHVPGGSSPEPRDAVERHRAAVAGSLRFASESAARADYRDALGWLQVLESVGEQLPADYVAKRQTWLGAVASDQETPGSHGYQNAA